MRERRTSGSEGGAAQLNAPSLPLSPPTFNQTRSGFTSQRRRDKPVGKRLPAAVMIWETES